MSLRRAGMHVNRRTAARFASGVAFAGSFAALFPGAYQVVQTDRGLTYGGTMLASGTTPPVITITGALTTVPVPITVTDVLPGILGTWTGQVSYDGGVTQAQSFTSAATVPLTGAGSGLTLNIAAGVAAGDNVWKATCAALTDQTANGKTLSQATASLQPVITVGLNGKPGLLFDGVDDFMSSTVGGLFGTVYDILVAARFLQFRNNVDTLVSGGSGNFSGTIYASAANTLSQYSGSIVNSIAYSNTSPTRFHAKFKNSTSDSLRVGSNAPVTGQNAGALTDLVRKVGQGSGTQDGNVEVFALIYTPPVTPAAFDAALNSLAGYGSGSFLV